MKPLNTPEDLAAFQKALDAMPPEDRAKLDAGMRVVMRMPPMTAPNEPPVSETVPVPLRLLRKVTETYLAHIETLPKGSMMQDIAQDELAQLQALLSAPQGPAEKTCDTCKHWAMKIPEPMQVGTFKLFAYGECQHCTHYPKNGTETRITDQGHIRCGPKFGCRHWAALE